MPHQEPGVHAEPALERVEVLTEGRPVPRHAVLQGGERHALDLGHHPADVVGVLGVDGGQREPAVAPDDRRHAVDVGGRGQRVPEELRVVVGVGVDHAGHDHEPAGVELDRRLFVDLADGHDPAVADADIGQAAGLTGPVHDRAGSDDVVEHGTSGAGAHGGCRTPKSDDPSAYRWAGRPSGPELRRVGPGRIRRNLVAAG